MVPRVPSPVERSSQWTITARRHCDPRLYQSERKVGGGTQFRSERGDRMRSSSRLGCSAVCGTCQISQKGVVLQVALRFLRRLILDRFAPPSGVARPRRQAAWRRQDRMVGVAFQYNRRMNPNPTLSSHSVISLASWLIAVADLLLVRLYQ